MSAVPLRIVQVGAGGMGQAWIRAITRSADTALVGLVDLDVGAAERSLAAAGLEGVAVGTSVAEAVERADADAVVDVTVPVAHLPVNVEALAAGVPVLCEKPAAPTVAEALRLVGASLVHGRPLMISQSRRRYAAIDVFRERIRELGGAGVLTAEFFKAPRFGGFREEMEHVLLVDMAIHAFDAARHLLEADPVAVYCEEWNPAWSWYGGAASASALFEFEGGARFSYTGSWCADGLETSWNGSWRANGPEGTATWDGERRVEAERVADGDRAFSSADVEPGEAEEIAGSLAEFVEVVRRDAPSSGLIASNVFSLAMVEAAVASSDMRSRIRIADVIRAAHGRAIADEHDVRVRETLAAWADPVAALRAL